MLANFSMDASSTEPAAVNARLLKLTEFPQVGKTVTEIDVTGNKISALPPSLPDALKGLTITGNLITALPSYLARLPSLELLYASTNCIQDADIVFRCPVLLHASLAYNAIGRLGLPGEAPVTKGPPKKPAGSSSRPGPNRSPSPPKGTAGRPYGALPSSRAGTLSVAASKLVLLNLSHNDLVDLKGTLRALGCLPCLANLFLMGNPLVLCDKYRERTTAALPALQQLDGSQVAERGDAGAGAGPMSDSGPEDARVELRISLSGLETPLAVPTAAAGDVPDGVRSSGKDDKSARAAPSTGAKKDAGKGGSKDAAGKKGGKSNAKEAEPEPFELPPPVTFSVVLRLGKGAEAVPSPDVPQKPSEPKVVAADEPVPAADAPFFEHADVFAVGVRVRDILRDGVKLVLLKTERTPPPPLPDAIPDSDHDPARDPGNWKVATSELGWVVLQLPQLLDGQTREVKRTVAFVRPQPLFNDAKVLLALDKQRLLSAYDSGQARVTSDGDRELISETSRHAGRIAVAVTIQPWSND